MILISPNASPSVFDFNACRFRFENLEKYKKETVVVNLSSEHWGGFSLIQQLHDDLENHDFDFWILSHDPRDHEKLPRVIYYPWYYVYSKASLANDIDIKKSRKFSLGCLHGNPRPHRIVNYFALQDAFSNRKICSTINRASNMPWRRDDPEITVHEKQRWENVCNSFRDHARVITDIKDVIDLNLPALNESYVFLVTETTVIDRIFISEKTWKPIAAGQFFFTLGNAGSIAHLRDLGVDVFDDIIDHHYDQIEHWRDRMDCLHKSISKFLNKNLEEIWTHTFERRKENQRKFFSGEFMPLGTIPFDEQLENTYVIPDRLSSLDT